MLAKYLDPENPNLEVIVTQKNHSGIFSQVLSPLAVATSFQNKTITKEMKIPKDWKLVISRIFTEDNCLKYDHFWKILNVNDLSIPISSLIHHFDDEAQLLKNTYQIKDFFYQEIFCQFEMKVSEKRKYC